MIWIVNHRVLQNRIEAAFGETPFEVAFTRLADWRESSGRYPYALTFTRQDLEGRRLYVEFTISIELANRKEVGAELLAFVNRRWNRLEFKPDQTEVSEFSS